MYIILCILYIGIFKKKLNKKISKTKTKTANFILPVREINKKIILEDGRMGSDQKIFFNYSILCEIKIIKCTF